MAVEVPQENAQATQEKPKQYASSEALQLWRKASSEPLPELREDMPPAERREAIRTVVSRAKDVGNKSNFVLGGALFEISQNGYFKDWEITEPDGSTRPFESFEEYCESEHGMKKSKAYDLINIYKKFVVELEFDANKLSSLDWSKARELVTVITEKNYEDILDKTKGMSYRQVKEFARDMKQGSSSQDAQQEATKSADAVTKVTFKFAETQYEVFVEAIKIATSLYAAGDEEISKEKALEHICGEFLTETFVQNPSVTNLGLKLDDFIKTLENNYKVRLSVEEYDQEYWQSKATEAELQGNEEQQEEAAEEVAQEAS